MKRQEVLQLFDRQKDELIELCRSILKAPSENPPGDTKEVSRVILEYLEENGISATTHETLPGRINILAELGPDGGRELIYCGHSDTVPVGDLSRWDRDPFSGDLEEGILYGRGASDMKAGLTGQLFALAFLKRNAIPLKGKLKLVIVPDEETGSHHGLVWLMEQGLIKGDGCLIGEPSGRLNPTIGQKGSGGFRLSVYGVSGHASLSPLIGRSAILDAYKAIDAVSKLTEMRIPVPEELQELVETSRFYGREEGLDHVSSIYDRISFNVGRIHGGTAANVIPDKCVVDIDCRLPFGISRPEHYRRIRELLDSLDIRYDLEETGFDSSANYTSPEDPVVKCVTDNISFVTGEKGYGVLQWACSDARLFRQQGIPVLQYGPAILETIHSFNERVEVENLLECTKVYILAAMDYLNETVEA